MSLQRPITHYKVHCDSWRLGISTQATTNLKQTDNLRNVNQHVSTLIHYFLFQSILHFQCRYCAVAERRVGYSEYSSQRILTRNLSLKVDNDSLQRLVSLLSKETRVNGQRPGRSRWALASHWLRCIFAYTASTCTYLSI